MNASMVLRVAVRLAGIVCAGSVLTIIASATVLQENRSRSTVAFNGKLPVLDGRNLSATLVDVTYPPGGVNPAHRHPCPVIGYVLAGAVRMQLKGQQERVFRVGETFFESPADVHVVSANASQDEPARFLAYFICDRETPLTLPAPREQEPQ
jgi:quercetin dioxygenase-like cupin family protein